MSRRKPSGKKKPAPARRGRKPAVRSRPSPAARPIARTGGPFDLEHDLERWLPALFSRALGRKPGPAPSLAAGELRAAARAVRELSRGFTGGRDLAGAPYFTDRSALAGYLLYYWPVSYVQARLVFRSLLPPGALSGARVLDAGSGPGPMSAAALDEGAGRVTALDARREASLLARALAGDCGYGRGRGFEMTAGRWDLTRGGDPPPGRFDVILLGHVLNELWPGDPGAVEKRADRVAALAGRLADGGRIVILEPALFSTTRDLLRLRDLLAARGFPVLAPCLRQGPCPCLRDQASTCHADRPWRPPRYLVRLAHAARLGKESLRFSPLVLGKPESRPPRGAGPDVFRVVSERMLSKSGRLRLFICNERGRFTLSAKPRGDEPWLETFLSLRRYDAVRVRGAEERENGLGLVAESGLEKVDVDRG